MSYEVILEPVLTINGINNLQSMLDEVLSKDIKSVVLKAKEIEKIDTAAMQLLLTFVRQAEAQSLAVEWAFPSHLLQEQAELLGLSEALNLPKSV